MMAHPELVLAIHPTSRGFGWALFDGPDALDDWGLAYVRGNKVASCRRRLALLLERHRPDRVVLERSALPPSGRGSRRADLLRAATELAEELRVRVKAYGRPEVRLGLQLAPDATREDVAQAVAARLPEIAHMLPPKRRAWDSLDRRLALFSAAAIALAHFSRRPM